jgi:CubicO group peptidase (beta-lactamase class C family)
MRRPLHLACTASLLAAALTPLRGQARAGLDPNLLPLAAGYAAKVTASAVFVSGRTVESVLQEELAADRPLEAAIRLLLRLDVDRANRRVTARLGTATATAVATAELGCTLVVGDVPAAELAARRIPKLAGPTTDPRLIDFPVGDRVPTPPVALQRAKPAIEAAVAAAFAEPATGPKRRTRAVVVLADGQLLAERYADGCSATMPLPGWSMAKSVVAALVALREADGRLPLDVPPATPQWSTDDPRRQVRRLDLLTMTSGLEWHEDYADPNSAALRMLFGSADTGAAQASMPLAAKPGDRFRYSSGSTNLLCREVRHTFDDDRAYWAYPRDRLFAPLGMTSAVLELDASGTWVGSSYVFATARDWARLGNLFAHDGRVGSQQVLPPGWVARAATPSQASAGRYGLQLWTNRDPDGDGPAAAAWPELPPTLLRLDGFEGQFVVVVPEERLVVVRLGCTKQGDPGVRALVAAVRAALVAAK